MIHYRPFLNSDPPAIVEIWRSHRPERGLAQAVTPALLDRLVFSKPYFDRRGLILAWDDRQPVGFIHAGFGPASDFGSLSKTQGISCLLMVAPRPDRPLVAAELIARSEQYLVESGARELFAGEACPLNPFYLGLYGGSELSGILASDRISLDAFRAAGYVEARQYSVVQRRLSGFRPPVDRQQMQVRRRYHVQAMVDPPTNNWWEACTVSQTERTRFMLVGRDSGHSCGQTTFWDMEPLASHWGVHAAGVLDVQIAPDLRRQGLAVFLLSEAMRQIRSQGATLVEVHVPEDNVPALGLVQKLGFQQVDRGFVLRKPKT